MRSLTALMLAAPVLALAQPGAAQAGDSTATCLDLVWTLVDKPRPRQPLLLPASVCLFPTQRSNISISHGIVRNPWLAMWYGPDTLSGGYVGLPVEAGAAADTLLLFGYQRLHAVVLVAIGDSLVGQAEIVVDTTLGRSNYGYARLAGRRR